MRSELVVYVLRDVRLGGGGMVYVRY